MAYGVKYRLEFSDVLGNGKKIEILKDGYSGSVLPLIGTDEPLSIKWDGDDDFYSPIIGSTCTINLFVTDDVQYDNFYAFDEEEFQVKIYFKNPTDVYVLYWVGFIVTDSYKQAMAAPPYQISLQAHDGIGLLDSKFIEINNGDSFTSAVGGTGRLRENLVNDCISKTNLGLDVYFCTGLRTSNSVSSGYLPDATAGFGGAKYDNDLKVVNCKEYIENTLKTMNCRIFQALGRWYIISNSDYQDFDFFSDVFDGTISSNIRDAETKRLQQEEDEIPQFLQYDSTGTFVGTSIIDALLETKKDLTPINNDLVVEYIPPAKIISNKIEIDPYNNFNEIANYDPTFELPTNDWTITSSRGTIGEFDIIASGKKSFRTNNSTTSTSTFTLMLNTNNAPLSGFIDGDKLTFGAIYYFDGTISGSVPRFNYDIKRTIIGTVRYWNASNDTWQASTANNYVEIQEENQFGEVDLDITMDTNAGAVNFEIIIYLPYRSSSTTLNYLYLDNVFLRRDNPFYKDKVAQRTVTTNSKIIESDYKPFRVTFEARGAQDSDTDVIEKRVTQQKINDFRTHVTRYEGTFRNDIYSTFISPLYKIWVNFSEKFVEAAFAGTSTTTFPSADVESTDKVGWYITGGNITTPVKITSVNFGIPGPDTYTLDTAISFSAGDIFALSSFNAVNSPVSNEYPTHEPVSCMIDSMEYVVKSNQISVVMHVPNQDDDVSSSFLNLVK